MKEVTAFILMSLSAATLSAHPGHGPLDTHILHYIFSLDHLLALVVTGVIVYALHKRITLPSNAEVHNNRRHARNVDSSRNR